MLKKVDTKVGKEGSSADTKELSSSVPNSSSFLSFFKKRDRSLSQPTKAVSNSAEAVTAVATEHSALSPRKSLSQLAKVASNSAEAEVATEQSALSPRKSMAGLNFNRISYDLMDAGVVIPASGYESPRLTSPRVTSPRVNSDSMSPAERTVVPTQLETDNTEEVECESSSRRP